MAKKIPADNATFRYLNLNPKGHFAGDCVVRAIAAFLNWDWKRTYESLASRGIKHGYMINDDKNFQSFLAEMGYVKHKQPRFEDGSKYTAGEFCTLLAVPGNTYILRLANHLTFIGPDCRIWDTWDCSKKSVGNYWVKITV